MTDETAQNRAPFFGDALPHSVAALFSQYLKDGETGARTRLAS